VSKIDEIIEGVIGREGRYSNHPSDTGGETMWGITIAVARRNGYHAPMRNMPREVAASIYRSEYVVRPGFADVLTRSEAIAEELVDTGVNMGPAIPAMFLQQALNALNVQGKHYADIREDGDVGPATLRALDAYLKRRGKEGEAVMVKALNALQGARYLDLARRRAKNEDFVYGWLRTRL
jgi:lysozyme family protein